MSQLAGTQGDMWHEYRQGRTSGHQVVSWLVLHRPAAQALHRNAHTADLVTAQGAEGVIALQVGANLMLLNGHFLDIANLDLFSILDRVRKEVSKPRMLSAAGCRVPSQSYMPIDWKPHPGSQCSCSKPPHWFALQSLCHNASASSACVHRCGGT